MREAVLRVRALCLTSFKAVAVSAMFLGGAVLLDPVTPGSLVSSANAQDDKASRISERPGERLHFATRSMSAWRRRRGWQKPRIMRVPRRF